MVTQKVVDIAPCHAHLIDLPLLHTDYCYDEEAAKSATLATHSATTVTVARVLHQTFIIKDPVH
jgi:hypothetical protein